jgi:hypothetical protein
MRRINRAVRWWFEGWQKFAAVAGGRAEDLVGARPWGDR